MVHPFWSPCTPGDRLRRLTLRVVSVWLVVGDSELRALLLAVGEEAGIPMAAIEPETVGTLLSRDERPEAMLIPPRASSRCHSIRRDSRASSGSRSPLATSQPRTETGLIRGST